MGLVWLFPARAQGHLEVFSCWIGRDPCLGMACELALRYQNCNSPGVIRKMKSGEYRLYSRKADAKTGKRRNLGTFASREAAEKHERAVQYFKRAG